MMEGGSVGLSLHVGSLEIRGPNSSHHDKEEEEEEAKDEQQRQKEMQGMLANAFDDLEESDYLQQSSYYAPSEGGGVGQQGVLADLGAGHYTRRDDEGGGGGHYTNRYDADEGARQFNDIVNKSFENHPRLYNEQEPQCEDGYEREQASAGSRESYDGELRTDGDLSDRSVTPWSDRSRSLVSSHGNHFPEDNVNPDNVRLNLDAGDSTYFGRENLNGYTRQKESPHLDSGVSLHPQVGGHYASAGDHGEPTVSELQRDFLGADTAHDQLKLLYDARGRELDRLSEEVEHLRAEKAQQSSALQHEMTLLRAEKDQLEVSRKQSQILLSEKESQLRSLRTDHQETNDKLTQAKTDRTKLTVKLEAAETLIKTLEQNICDLQSTDSLAKSRQMHEDFLYKLQGSHQEEVTTLRAKLTTAQLEGQELQHRVADLRDELQQSREKYERVVVEKSRAVGELRSALEVRQQQCDTLLASGAGGAAARDLQQQLDVLAEEKKELEKELTRVKARYTEAKEDLESYQTALKLGVLSNAVSTDDSMAHMKMKVPASLTYEDTIQNSSQDITKEPSPVRGPELERKLREELQRCLHVLQFKQDKLNDVSNELSDQTKVVRKLKAHLKSCQVEVKEQQAVGEQLKEEKHTLITELSKMRLNALATKEENTHLKQELTSILQQLAVLKNSGEELSEYISRLDNRNQEGGFNQVLAVLTAAVERHSRALQESQCVERDLWQQLKEDNIKLLKDKALRADRINVLISALDSLKTKLQDTSSGDAPSRSVGASVTGLLDEFKHLAATVNEEESELFVKILTAQNELSGAKLDLQKQQDKEQQKKHNSNHETLSQQGPSKDFLESSKQTYLRFHEEAINRVKQDFADVQAKLEHKIEALLSELSDVKTRYIDLCREKSELEQQLEGGREPGVSGEHLRIALSAMAQKHDDQLQLLKRNHAAELQANLQRKDTRSQQVQTDCCMLNGVNGGSIEERGDACGNVQDTNQDLESLVKHLADQLHRASESLAQQIDSMKQGQAIDSLETCQNVHRCLENLTSSVLNRSGVAAGIAREYNDTLIEQTSQSIIDEYKKLVEKLKQEKWDLRHKYEEQVQVLLEQLKTVSTEAVGMQREAENRHLEIKSQDVLKLTRQVSLLHKQREEIAVDHERVVSKLSDEVQNLESDLKEATHTKSVDLVRFKRDLENMKMEKCLLKEENANLKLSLNADRTQSKEKVANLKDKYRRLLAQFDKLKEGSARQVEHYLSEARRLHTQSEDNRRQMIAAFDWWLKRSRAVLGAGLAAALGGVQARQQQDKRAGTPPCPALAEAEAAARAMLKTLEEFKMNDTLSKLLEETGEGAKTS